MYTLSNVVVLSRPNGSLWYFSAPGSSELQRGGSHSTSNCTRARGDVYTYVTGSDCVSADPVQCRALNVLLR